MAQFRQVRWSLDDLDVEIAPEAQVTRQAEELEDNKAQASQDTAQYEENVTSLNRIQRQTSSTISVP
jgi:sensor domain CHASE-containing protein